MAYGIDSQINERVDTYSSDPQKLMQRYTQSQSLLDLLALQKLKSEKEAAMRNMQTQMQPPMNTVRDQREQQVLDMTRNEVAQQAMQGGQQLALNKQREMQARGLPAQAAPNMQGMADGGIVGYQEGGFMGPPEANMLQRMGQGLKNYGANAQESMGILKEAKAGMGIPYGERSAVMKQVRDEIEAQNQNRDPNFIERMGQKLMDTGLDVEESKAILKKFYNNMGKTYEEMSNGMAMGGGVKGYAGPDGSEVGAYDEPYVYPYGVTGMQESLEIVDKITDLENSMSIEKDSDKRRMLEMELDSLKKFGGGVNGISKRDFTNFVEVQKLKNKNQSQAESTGMAMGGEVKGYAGPDGSDVELDEDLIASLLAQQPEATAPVYLSSAERRAALDDADAARAQLREARRAEERTRQELRERGLSGPEINRYLSSRLDAVEPGGIGELKQPQFDTRSPQTGPFLQPLISDTSVGTAEGGNAADNTTRQELFNELATIGDAQTETPRTNLVTPEVEERMQTAASADPTALAEAAETRRAALAQTAYGIPQALQDAYATRQKSVDEANAAMNDPKKQSRDEFRAMLSGFATPGGIARSGIAAGQGVAGVQEAAIQRKKDQGEEAFGITKELADLQRAASIEAYKSGEQGYDRAYRSAATAANASFQALSNIDIGAQNRANANRLADRSAKLETINMQLRSLESQDNMKSRDRNTQVTILNGAQRDASSIRGEIQKAIAESSFLSEAKRRPYLDYIAARKAELQATQSRIDAVAATLGIQTTSPAASGAGTGSTALPAGFVPD